MVCGQRKELSLLWRKAWFHPKAGHFSSLSLGLLICDM